MESLIFAGMALAWLVYLVPKGIKLHEESVQARAVDDFSDQMRVVARRDAHATTGSELTVNRPRRAARKAAAEATPADAHAESDSAALEAGAGVEADDLEQDDVVEAPRRRNILIRSLDPRAIRATRAARAERSQERDAERSAKPAKPAHRPSSVRPAQVAKAAKQRTGTTSGKSTRTGTSKAAASPASRRRRVLTGIVLALVVVAVLAGVGIVNPWTVVAPVAVLLAWLVTCRLMVRGEQAARTSGLVSTRDAASVGAQTQVSVDPETGEIIAVAEVDADEAHTPWVAAPEAAAAPGSWDLMPTTLPTYVTKDAAEPRPVKQFDLDSTGVWSAGRSAKDSEVARAAAEQDQAAREQARRDEGRAFGS